MLYRAVTTSCCKKNSKAPNGSNSMKNKFNLNYIWNFRSHRSVNSFRLPYENQLINFVMGKMILLCF